MLQDQKKNTRQSAKNTYIAKDIRIMTAEKSVYS